MSLLSEETLREYVYRRVPSHVCNPKRNTVDGGTFLIEADKKGLSVYRADKVTPYGALDAMLNVYRKELQSADDDLRRKAETQLAKNLMSRRYLKKVIVSLSFPLRRLSQWDLFI